MSAAPLSYVHPMLHGALMVAITEFIMLFLSSSFVIIGVVIVVVIILLRRRRASLIGHSTDQSSMMKHDRNNSPDAATHHTLVCKKAFLTLAVAMLLLAAACVPLLVKRRHLLEARAHMAALAAWRAALRGAVVLDEGSVVRDGWVPAAARRAGAFEGAQERGPPWSGEACPLIRARAGLPSRLAVQHDRAVREFYSALQDHWTLENVDDDGDIGDGEDTILMLTRASAAAVFLASPSSDALHGTRKASLEALGTPPHLARALLSASDMLSGTGRLIDCKSDPDLLRVRRGQQCSSPIES